MTHGRELQDGAGTDRENMRWSRVLRGLREARGITRAGWAARLGYGRTTVQRWESGESVPDAAAEEAIVALCRAEGLLGTHKPGATAGLELSAERLREILTAARLGKPSVVAHREARAQNTKITTSVERWTGPALPTGTVTFLFTDVEGSSRLWDEHPDVMPSVVARHDALLGDVFEHHNGIVVRPRGEGDSLFVVFLRASDAVAAAAAGLQAVEAEDWGEVGRLRLRMALHTGEADLRAGDYYGPEVNRCARIRSAGHGGQCLLSEATTMLVKGVLPHDSTLQDLGPHELRGISQPMRLFQLCCPGMRADFPPLNTAKAPRTNLSAQRTSFLGRDQELQAARTLLLDGNVGLVTMVGPAGTGKTRLAIQVAGSVLDSFPDGVFFVDLSAIVDPALVAPAIAQVLGVREAEGPTIADALRIFLIPKMTLLILDNFEQIMGAADLVADLISMCPRLTLLATSRMYRLNNSRPDGAGRVAVACAFGLV